MVRPFFSHLTTNVSVAWVTACLNDEIRPVNEGLYWRYLFQWQTPVDTEFFYQSLLPISLTAIGAWKSICLWSVIDHTTVATDTDLRLYIFLKAILHQGQYQPRLEHMYEIFLRDPSEEVARGLPIPADFLPGFIAYLRLHKDRYTPAVVIEQYVKYHPECLEKAEVAQEIARLVLLER